MGSMGPCVTAIFLDFSMFLLEGSRGKRRDLIDLAMVCLEAVRGLGCIIEYCLD